MSRWMIPLAWAASGASEISIARLRSTSVSNGFTRNAVLQRHALEKLHNDEGVPVLLTDVHAVMPAPVATSYGHGNDSSTKAVPARKSRASY